MSAVNLPMRYTLSHRLACFRHAWLGLRWMITNETNARIHLGATITILALGGALRISRADWLWLIVAIALVWCAEALNTAIEQLANEISAEHREHLGRAKDLGAGAVLVAAMAAAVIGMLIFLPHLQRLAA
jgi:diacylglycerol kinase (ATP)